MRPIFTLTAAWNTGETGDIYSEGSTAARQVLDADVTPVLEPDPLQGVVRYLEAVFGIIKSGGPAVLVGDQEIINVPYSIVRPGAHVHLADADVSATVSTYRD